MKYPDYDTYTKLYGRYLTKSVEPFFDGVDLKGKRVLDLCAGGGQLSQYALDHDCGEVLMVDTAPHMLNPSFNHNDWRVARVSSPVEWFLMDFKDIPYDVVVVRQAINYWFKNVSGEDIARVVKKGGVFTFNTFGNKPSETPNVREYFHQGIAYKEISYLVGDMVHHVQVAAGFAPHMTSFHWISPDEFRQKLSPYFIIREVVDGPSSMWYCTKL